MTVPVKAGQKDHLIDKRFIFHLICQVEGFQLEFCDESILDAALTGEDVVCIEHFFIKVFEILLYLVGGLLF